MPKLNLMKVFEDVCMHEYSVAYTDANGISGTKVHVQCGEVKHLSVNIPNDNVSNDYSVKYCMHDGVGKLEYSKIGASCNNKFEKQNW